MSKRVRLLKSMKSFQTQRIAQLQIYSKEFPVVAQVIRKLSKRIKNAERPKYKVHQLEFLKKFEVSFIKYRGRKVSKKIIEAVSHGDARKIITHLHQRIRKVKVKQIKTHKS